MRASNLSRQVLALLPLYGLSKQRLKLVSLLTYRSLQLTFGYPGGNGVPLKCAVTNIPSYREETIRLYGVGVLAVEKIIGNLPLRLIGISLTIFALTPFVGLIHRGVYP